jgi:hypothetical protein
LKDIGPEVPKSTYVIAAYARKYGKVLVLSSENIGRYQYSDLRLGKG